MASSNLHQGVRPDSNEPEDPIYPPIGEEPFNLSPDELEEAWRGPLPGNEKEVRERFEQIVSATFELFPEVYMRNPNGDRLRIDYVGRDKSGTINGLIGFEMKSVCVATEAMGDFISAVAQSVDYSKARIQSDLVDKNDWFGSTLKWVFTFPCPYQIYETNNSSRGAGQRDMWAQGALKLAGKFGVGAMAYAPNRKDWGLFLGGHPAFWAKTGPTGLATRHAKRGHVGSGR